ncbi:MAG: ADP-glyceromanno-heptose 6-epimerase, partial [Halioglobus sp.]|nr:ADP-glyceromanno-heptose 6-epimerase [Halioglobus sp.]
AGFIGSNLARMLIGQGADDVLVVDDLSDGHKFSNIADLQILDYMDRQEFLQRLRNDADFVRQLTAVLHQGACSTTTEWDGKYMMENNFTYSKTLLHRCLEYDIPLIYASSAAVYGSSQQFAELPVNERPLNVYGYSKLLFDQYVRRLRLAANQQVAGLRYFNVYGPREQHKASMASVAYHFNQQLLADHEVRLFEGCNGFDDGEQQRDFVYVDDICRVNLWFLEHRDVSGVFNAGSGRAQSYNDVAHAVIKWHGRGRIRYVPFPEHLKGAYQSYTQADLSALRATGCDVGFRDVAHGISEYLDTLAG